ncbi:MAG: phosphoglucomutase/phosphomannomutase family protein [Acidobacteriota bacterium]|jgi:phosphomannomutase
MSDPRFGTDGWRAEIAREFTLANLRRVVAAITAVYRERGARRAAVSYDHRFLADRLAREAAAVLQENGIQVRMSDRPETTPALSCQVVGSGADFGLMLTASHNPPEFLGLKIKTAGGASAPPAITRAVEERLCRPSPDVARPAGGPAPTVVSFRAEHEARMAAVVDLERIRNAPLHVVVDSMHGTGGRIVEEMLGGGAIRVDTLRGERDPLFGGQAPEPTRDRMGPLLERMSRGAAVGFATDGDGDRIAAVDDRGAFVSPLRIVAVLALHLIRHRRMEGGLAKTFANTVYLDRIAKAEGRVFHCLPVGFKHVAALLERGELLIGGEESGGIGVAGYLPERDGLLAGLLLVEAVAASGKPLSALVEALTREFGDYRYGRRDLHLEGLDVAARLDAIAREPPARIAGLGLTGLDTLDGLKLLFGDHGWLLLRASGTEPVIRVYAEVLHPAPVASLIEAGVRLVGGGR